MKTDHDEIDRIIFIWYRMGKMKLLDIRNINKTYKKVKAIDDLSFSVDECEMVGLLGLNGAGKSTTIEMVATLLKPDSGSIFYKGSDVFKKPEVIRREMGYVPQNIMLFEELSGLKNLEFWGKAYGLKGAMLKEAIERTITICDLKDKINLPVKSYSGGMQRRLNIGVAVLHMPRLLILDEATVGVDIVSAHKILRLIQELNRYFGTAVIFTSHNMQEAEFLCQRFLILKQGRLIEDISKTEILNHHSNLQEYFWRKVSTQEI